jgi:hypothetical protein
MSTPTRTPTAPARGTGRYTFAAVIMAILGFFLILAAINEWADSRWLAERTYGLFTANNLVWWGVVDFILGVIALYAAYSLWHAGASGAVIAMVWAIFAVVRWIWYIPAQPWLSLLIIGLSIGVIYTLCKDPEF